MIDFFNGHCDQIQYKAPTIDIINRKACKYLMLMVKLK